ncbi:NDP-sugar synthase [bacterium]|nr:NDP-sugar synthase [bacterium]
MMKNAIILAAGFGTRLKPFSNVLPKPLFPILGKPALYYVFKRLTENGIDNFFVNTHHLADKMISSVTAITPIGTNVSIFVERDKILGTAGGIGNIFKNIGEPDETILVHNGDVLERFDIKSAVEFHKSNNFLATLIVIDEPKINSVLVDGEIVSGFVPIGEKVANGLEKSTYSGVAILESEIIATFPNDRFGSLVEYLMPFVEMKKVGAFFEKHFWCDFGTIREYLELHRKILVDGEYIEDYTGKEIWIAESARIDDTVEISGFASIGDSVKISGNVRIANSVVWGRTVIENGTYINSLISPEYCVEI